MTTLIDRIPDVAAAESAAEPARRLRATMAACRLRFTWFGVQRTLTPEQRAAAAEAFDADGRALSAGKKLIDTRHAAYRAVTAIRTRTAEHWRGLSLPFPEPGVRLVPQDRVDELADAMADYRTELADAVANLDAHFGELKAAAAARLGSLFDAADYPETLIGLFDVACDFPSVEPPDYLTALSPRLFAEEQARVAARFEEAVRLAESAFVEEFARLVAHLCERTSGSDPDGSRKVFRDSAVGNLHEFFERFRSLNVRSNAELDALVAEAQRVVRGVAAQDLRDSPGLRGRVAAELSRVRTTLDDLLVERPRRRVVRPGATSTETP